MPQPHDPSAVINEGKDGFNQIYRERLLPGIAAWVLVFFMTASLGIAYGYVFGNTFGVVLTFFATGAIYALMYFGSPVISIDELVIRVADARLPRRFVGSVNLLDETKTSESRRTATHRDAYIVMRAAIKESIVFDVKDESDPHPYWQFSSRNPAKLISALNN
ncbi:MAG: hypothetical protein RLZZ571_1002 [Actinomycetota bacterium]|jgi:hypothetical protein